MAARPARALAVAVVTLLWAASAAAQAVLPTLNVDASASLEGVANQLRALSLESLGTAMTLAGMTHPGPPINVLLIDEEAELAENTPRWIAGFADGSRSLVVMFPDRARGYPTDGLDTLLQHEVAHVLFARAAGGRPVPRWFNEGLAIAAERPAGLSDRSRLAWTLVWDGALDLDQLEALFGQGRGASQRAYAVSGALVRELIRAYGNDAPGRILDQVAAGATFDSAFRTATGAPLNWVVARFWRTQQQWSRWIPFLTGPSFLWMGITSLAVLAIVVHRRRRAARRAAWEEEERIEAELAETRRREAERLARERLLDADPRASGSSYEVH